MTVVTTKEFNMHQKKYFDLALDEEVCIKRGENMFYLAFAPVNTQFPEQPVLEPDDDFRSAISGEEFKKRALEIVEKVHHKFSNK